jgi:hypothetical protein
MIASGGKIPNTPPRVRQFILQVWQHAPSQNPTSQVSLSSPFVVRNPAKPTLGITLHALLREVYDSPVLALLPKD